jgi:hypothetical protein
MTGQLAAAHFNQAGKYFNRGQKLVPAFHWLPSARNAPLNLQYVLDFLFQISVQLFQFFILAAG